MSAHDEKKDAVLELVEGVLAPLGFSVVDLELHRQREKKLQIFIEHRALDKGITVDDCAIVSKELDEPLEAAPLIQELFKDSYDLEVSSPGIQRPLRKPEDFIRFAGQQVRVHVFRSLKADEIENPGFLEKNPKQKHFLGLLEGLQEAKLRMKLEVKKSQFDEIRIPLVLISKAHLEPQILMEKGPLS